MSSPNIPTLRLPTSDFDQMRHMSNWRLICVLRSHVLAPDRVHRFSPRPPADHDAYVVRHDLSGICISLFNEGQLCFRCLFLPSEGEY